MGAAQCMHMLTDNILTQVLSEGLWASHIKRAGASSRKGARSQAKEPCRMKSSFDLKGSTNPGGFPSNAIR